MSRLRASRVAAVAGVAVLAVVVARRLPQVLHTVGSRPDERDQPLPGDDILPGARLIASHGIDIEEPPERVWPWVAQLGQGRAGFYTYAWVENFVGCQIVNADRIHPEWQHPEPGDVFRLHPEIGLRVARVEPGHALVVQGAGGVDSRDRPLDDPGYDFTWAFVVEPGAGGGTRLLTRERYFPRTTQGRAMVQMGAAMSAVMTHGMLRGVRQRVAATRTAG